MNNRFKRQNIIHVWLYACRVCQFKNQISFLHCITRVVSRLWLDFFILCFVGSKCTAVRQWINIHWISENIFIKNYTFIITAILTYCWNNGACVYHVTVVRWLIQHDKTTLRICMCYVILVYMAMEIQFRCDNKVIFVTIVMKEAPLCIVQCMFTIIYIHTEKVLSMIPV